MKILVVEDEHLISDAVCKIFADAGWFTDAVYDGDDALYYIKEESYDLVLLEGFGDSGWAKIEVVRSSVSPVGTAFQPMAIVGDVPGADFALDDPAALADWIENQMPSL